MTVDLLRQVADSMAKTAREAGVAIVTGDTKVVPRGACDKLFLTTTGIGVMIREGLWKPRERIWRAAGDVILVNGLLGDHGAAILCARGDMALETPIESDCAPLHGLIAQMIAAAPGIRFLRDATRGGVATVILNEIAEASEVATRDYRSSGRQSAIEVQGFCERFCGTRSGYISPARRKDRRRRSPGGSAGRARRDAGASAWLARRNHRARHDGRSWAGDHADGLRRTEDRQGACRRAMPRIC